jgi:MFS family permease
VALSITKGAARTGRSLSLRLDRLVDPLRDPSFRRLAVGRSVSVLGDWLLVAGLVGWVYGRTGSTGHVAVLMIVGLLPPVVGGILAGALADRFPRQRLLVAAELVCGVAVAGALVGVLRGSEAIVFACVALCAFVAPLGAVSMNALVPDIVPESRRTAGNAMLQLGQELAMATGALAAGITLSSGSAAGALGLDLASYVVAAVLFARIRCGSVPVTARSAASSGAGPALRHILGNPSLRAVALAFPLVTLATGLTNATLPRHLTDLGLGAGGYGFGLATLALGSAIGEIGIGASGSRLGARTLAVATAISCVPFAALAFASTAVAAIAALGVIGLVQGASEVALMTVVQQEAAPEFRGRAFGLVSTLIRTTMVSAVALAPLVNRLGPPRNAVLAATAVTAVAALVALGSPRDVLALAGAARRRLIRGDLLADLLERAPDQA